MSEAIPAPDSYPTICPYLYYQDGVAAMQFLEKAFGFRAKTDFRCGLEKTIRWFRESRG